MDAVKRLMNYKPVVIFSKSNCCMCNAIQALISHFGVNPTLYEVDKLSNGQQMEGALATRSGSFPAVFIGQKFVGGAKEILSLHLRGKLVPLLKKAKAIWI